MFVRPIKLTFIYGTSTGIIYRRLRGVPGVANGFTMIVKSERTLHLSIDRAQQFLAENVTQDAADEHGHKQQEYNYEVLKRK